MCSTLPEIRRPRGPRNARATLETKPNVTRARIAVVGNGEDRRADGSCAPDQSSAARSSRIDDRTARSPSTSMPDTLPPAASVRENDDTLVAANVVGIGQHGSLADDHARSRRANRHRCARPISDLFGHSEQARPPLRQEPPRRQDSFRPTSGNGVVTSKLQVTMPRDWWRKRLGRRATMELMGGGLRSNDRPADPTPPAVSALDAALSRVGDRWSLLPIVALLDGSRRFNDLTAALARHGCEHPDRPPAAAGAGGRGRQPAATRSARRACAYALTEDGRELAGGARAPAGGVGSIGPDLVAGG